VVWYEDPLTLTALGTWVLVIGTLILLYWQNAQTRELNSASSVMALRERFDAPHIRRARKILATRLLNNQREDITNLEVGAFFELISTLMHRRVLEEELIWEVFGTWITGYFWALRHPDDLIGRARERLHDPLIFHEFEWAAKRLLAIDAQWGFKPDAEAHELEARALLRREADLDSDGS
jgi:hypothetical protein